jgi:nicotinamidase-related amidase
MAGSADCAIVSELAPTADELVLAICGVATHLAVESVARDASDRGSKVSVIRDACAGPAELRDHALDKVLPAFVEIITSGDFVSAD